MKKAEIKIEIEKHYLEIKSHVEEIKRINYIILIHKKNLLEKEKMELWNEINGKR